MCFKVILLGLLVLIVAMPLVGRYSWQAKVDGLRGAMRGAMRGGELQTALKPYDKREIAALPAPVRRYFSRVLKDGQPMVASVRVEHRGTFNTAGDETEKWVPFTSTQYVVTQRPGFVWDARVRVAPGVPVLVHDAYVLGEGSLSARILGLVKVMEQPNTPELAQGELMRFFAEGAWYPTSLLPSQGVRWDAVNEREANATIIDGNTEVTLVFRFDQQGLIRSVYSHGRYRDVDGVQEATPWEGVFGQYAWRHGMLVPLEGEVRWLLPQGQKPYWRGHIQKIEYVFW